MTKKHNVKNKLYIRPSEYAEDWGGHKKRKFNVPFKALPFFCCGLSLSPFDEPLCTKEGIIFDKKYILPYIDQYHRNPVTGNELAKDELIPIVFHKNAEGAFHCPITYKVFNDHTHIVANRKSGHVYSYEAVLNLCKKANNWQDLITSEPFTQADLVTIQDPHNVATRKIDSFDFIIKGIEPVTTPVRGTPAESGSDKPAVQRNPFIDKVLEQVAERQKERENEQGDVSHFYRSEDPSPNNQPPTGPHGDIGVAAGSNVRKTKHVSETTAAQSASLTSTVMKRHLQVEYRDLTEIEILTPFYKWVKRHKKKGYVRMETTLGRLNIMLHCDHCPLATDSFIRHCASGFYADTVFFRSIPNFVIQGGDPTGTGKGGESAFNDKKPFADEFSQKLTHTGKGVVAMANNGRNSNGSQFYFTYKSCEHLNYKHVVFGKGALRYRAAGQGCERASERTSERAMGTIEKCFWLSSADGF
eukprot:GHVU01041965.1.p1 GENE.GHVU01041965.1~~GHVU01041965.1.p1  ORF type:complete len:472 (-),score=62.93 GHVU01041965.1:2336-3751(-)